MMSKLTMPTFVTTRDNNTVINKLLTFIGFARAGNSWTSARGDYNLSLWVNQPASVTEGVLNEFKDRGHSEEIDQAARTITKFLSQRGYKFLGSGVDQLAFLEPSTGQVLKIFRSGYNIKGTVSAGQKMGIFWINYCNTNSNNPYLPKFSGWETFKWEDQLFLQVRMERLGKFPYKWNHELRYIAELANGDRGNVSVDTYLKELLKYDESPTLAMHLGEDGLRVLWNTLVDLSKISKDKKWYFDLHAGNFMIRNDGTPVILDPWIE
jgi:hypothetical protein